MSLRGSWVDKWWMRSHASQSEANDRGHGSEQNEPTKTVSAVSKPSSFQGGPLQEDFIFEFDAAVKPSSFQGGSLQEVFNPHAAEKPFNLYLDSDEDSGNTDEKTSDDEATQPESTQRETTPERKRRRTKQRDATKRATSVKRRSRERPSQAASLKRGEQDREAGVTARRSQVIKPSTSTMAPDAAERGSSRRGRGRTRFPRLCDIVWSNRKKKQKTEEEADSKKHSDKGKPAGTDTEPPDADERGRATEKAYDGSLPRISGLLCIVKIFAAGWFPPEVSELLHKAAVMLDVGGDSSTQQAVESFKTAFLHIGGKPDGFWNTSLTDALSQLCEIRKSFKDSFSPLSERETSECIWTFARKFLFTPQQRQLPKRRQRTNLNRILKREVGCYHRLRAVVRMGLDGLATYDEDLLCYDENLLLLRLVHYIENVEREAKSYKDAGKRMHERQQKSMPQSKNIYGSLGQEVGGASSCVPSCAPSRAPARRAYGLMNQEIGGASSVPPAVPPRELQQKSMQPSTNIATVLKSTPKWIPRPSYCSRSAPSSGAILAQCPKGHGKDSTNKQDDSAKKAQRRRRHRRQYEQAGKLA